MSCLKFFGSFIVYMHKTHFVLAEFIPIPKNYKKVNLCEQLTEYRLSIIGYMNDSWDTKN